MVRYQNVCLIKLPAEIKIDNLLFLYCREGNCGMECITEKEGEKNGKKKKVLWPPLMPVGIPESSFTCLTFRRPTS